MNAIYRVSRIVAACLVLASPVSAQPAADRIWFGGPILTMAGKEPVYVEALAVKDGKIVFTGAKEKALAMKAKGTTVVDLDGDASCNRFTGAYVLSGSSLTFSNMASTKKMCFPALMEQEVRFLAALEVVAKAKCEMGCSTCSMPKTAWYSRHHGGKNSTLIHDWT